MTTNSLDWVIGYFSKKGSITADDYAKNYFDMGLIDSFGVIELIEEAEAAFNIKFTDEHFQDRRFSTISGLSDIINELK